MNEVTLKLCKKLDIDVLEIVKTVTTLISGNCFTFEENNKIVQNMSFKTSVTQQALELLENAMKLKVYDTLKEVDNDILKAVIN